ncbi:MAG: uncharacterized protein KVP18_002677 [Porospora cf. gigantea A]|uniref:uncharacterized protein n=1 Tax=Porospora cf. gigantea A TaxID=2853593 RepID=UPI00355A8874|nr:MAG: hypothetical protein KVP18_002677 [Porospora cf. gigantea A]
MENAKDDSRIHRMSRLFDDSIPVHESEVKLVSRTVTIAIDVPLSNFRCFGCLETAALVGTCGCYSCRACLEKKFLDRRSLRTGLV